MANNTTAFLNRAAASSGNIKSFTITKRGNGSSKAVDVTGAVADFYFYESVLSNTITATVMLVDTGYRDSGGKTQKTTGVISDLQLSGGERVDFELEDGNLKNETTLKIPRGMYINRIRDGTNSGLKDIFVLDLVSSEFIANEQTRVTQRYDGKISDHVQSILKNVLKDTGESPEIESTAIKYNFIGNSRKPLYVCTWLASKSVPEGASTSGKASVGKQAGYLFYQTRDRFHFVSIDKKLGGIGKGQNVKTFLYNNTGKMNPSTYDGNILNYTVNKTVDIGKDLALGSYNNNSIFFDFFSMNYKVRPYSVEDQKDGLNLTGKYMNLPEKDIISTPTRLMSHVLDVGTLPSGVNADQQLQEWKKDPTEPTFKATDTMVQSIMRYNQIFSIQTSIVIPGDFDIKAGDFIKCTIKDLDDNKNQNEDISGLYMVASVCHRLNPKETFTSLDLIKDAKESGQG